MLFLIRAGCVNGVPHPQTRQDTIAKQQDGDRRNCQLNLPLPMSIGLHAVHAAAVADVLLHHSFLMLQNNLCLALESRHASGSTTCVPPTY